VKLNDPLRTYEGLLTSLHIKSISYRGDKMEETTVAELTAADILAARIRLIDELFESAGRDKDSALRGELVDAVSPKPVAKSTLAFQAGKNAYSVRIFWDVTDEQLRAIASRTIVIALGTKARSKKGLDGVIDFNASDFVPGTNGAAVSKVAQLATLKSRLERGEIDHDEFNTQVLAIL